MTSLQKKWQATTLDNVCLEIVDCINKTAPVVESSTDYKMIRTTNVKQGRVNLDDAKCVTEDIFLKWTRRLLPKRNDVILTREAPLGEVGLLRTDEKVFLGQRTMIYRANPEQLNQFFLYYYLRGELAQAQINSLGSGSTVQHIRVPQAEKIEIQLPKISVQKKIAAVLSAYDDLIENNTRRIALLEKMAEEIYREWFVRLRFPGHEGVAFHKGIPEGWQSRNIGVACHVGDGAHASITRVETGVPYLTTKNFKSDGLDFSKIDYISPQDYDKYFGDENKSIKTPQSGDVLMGIIGSFGKPYLVEPSDRFGLSSSVSILRPKTEVLSSEYLYSYTRSSSFMESIHSIKSGSAQGFLSLRMIAWE